MARRNRKAAPTAQRPRSVPASNTRDATATVAAMTQTSGRGATQDLQPVDGQWPDMARLLPRPTSWTTIPFNPGAPLDPDAINGLRPDTGRPEPRLYEFPVTWNLSNSADRFIPWAILRAAADGISLFRRCIEIRKDHMLGLEWDVVISDRAIEVAQRKADKGQLSKAAPPAPMTGEVPSPAPDTTPTGANEGPSAGRAAAEDALRERLSPAIDAATKFLMVPDRGNGLKFGQWLSQLLEEVFVLDAAAIYPRRTFGGDLYSLEVLDGSTIKPLLDERGGRPLPPFPAYQQILYGFPRGEFVADTQESDDPDLGPLIPGAYPADELLYFRRVNRVWSPYGMSAVEQALDDGALYLARHRWMKGEYSDGTSVDGLYETPETLNWSPEQLMEYETEFNAVFAGNQIARRGARFLPPGIKPANQGVSGSDAIAERYKPEYDLHLIKLLAAHFDTTLPELGFTESKGLGSEGYHEGQQNVQMRKRRPIIRYIEEIVTGILHDQFGAPEELCFKFLGLDDEDEPAAADVAAKRQGTGVLTLNEMRDEIGRPRYEFPEADMPLLITARGIEVIEGAATRALAGQFEAPEQAPPPGQPGAPGAQSSPGSPPPGNAPGAKPQATPAAGSTPAQKAAEVGAYRRFLAKGARGRAFRWEHHSAAEAEAVIHPKAVAPRTALQWPGWDRDLDVAEVYAARLVRALTGAIGAATLAARWAEHGIADERAARAWLAGQGYDLGAVLTPVIHNLWTEGWLIGDLSAEVMLADHAERKLKFASVAVQRTRHGGCDVKKYAGLSPATATLDKAGNQLSTAVDWSSWEPGDATAARAIIEGSGRYPGLAAMIESGDLTISSIASHRLDELARVLSQAAGEGWGNGKTATAIRGLLNDPGWARMVAITEVSRASSSSSLSRYAANGVEAKSWMTAADQRVCPECSENEQEGDIPIGSYFQDGTDAPPGHPICRCAIAPGFLSASDVGAGAGGLGLSDLAGLDGLTADEAGLLATDETGALIDEFSADEAVTETELLGEWDQLVSDILSSVDGGLVDEAGTQLGGSMGDVSRIETTDGRTLVRKIVKDPYQDADETENAIHQRDADILHSHVAQALDLQAPTIAYRERTMFMSFMDGEIGSEFTSADPGALVRLLDLLIDNADRNGGNWMRMADGSSGVIDGGLGFQFWGAAGDVPGWRADMLIGFARDGRWIANPFSTSFYDQLAERLVSMRFRFEALGRESWFDRMMIRLDTLRGHASDA